MKKKEKLVMFDIKKELHLLHKENELEARKIAKTIKHLESLHSSIKRIERLINMRVRNIQEDFIGLHDLVHNERRKLRKEISRLDCSELFRDEEWY